MWSHNTDFRLNKFIKYFHCITSFILHERSSNLDRITSFTGLSFNACTVQLEHLEYNYFKVSISHQKGVHSKIYIIAESPYGYPQTLLSMHYFCKSLNFYSRSLFYGLKFIVCQGSQCNSQPIN